MIYTDNVRKISSVIFLITFFLISCQSNISSNYNKDIVDSALARLTKSKASLNDSIINILENQIAFRCIGNSNKEKNSASKKTSELPYNVIKSIKDDSTIISFKFISDCCRSFIEHIKITKDTLFLGYIPESNNICESYCEYSYQFAISKNKWATIYLRNKKI